MHPRELYSLKVISLVFFFQTGFASPETVSVWGLSVNTVFSHCDNNLNTCKSSFFLFFSSSAYEIVGFISAYLDWFGIPYTVKGTLSVCNFNHYDRELLLQSLFRSSNGLNWFCHEDIFFVVCFLAGFYLQYWMSPSYTLFVLFQCLFRFSLGRCFCILPWSYVLACTVLLVFHYTLESSNFCLYSSSFLLIPFLFF